MRPFYQRTVSADTPRLVILPKRILLTKLLSSQHTGWTLHEVPDTPTILSGEPENILSKSVYLGKSFFRLEAFIKEPKGREEAGRALEGSQVKPTGVEI
jgi:hypothetical protein